MFNMLIICLFLCHTLYDWSSACGIWEYDCVSALVDYYMLLYFSCSEEKSDEVTNLLGEVRSVLYSLDCLVKFETVLL